MKHCEEGELNREEPVELSEIIEEQLESSSEDLGEIEANPDKETFDDKNEISDHGWDPLGLTSFTLPSPAACMDEILEESIHSEAGEDEELGSSDPADPIILDNETDIIDKVRVEISTSINSGDLSPVVCLENITEKSLHSIVGEDEEIKTCNPLDKETSASFDKSEEEFGGNMEENTFKTWLAEVKKKKVFLEHI